MTFPSEYGTFCRIYGDIVTIIPPKNGAFRSLDASECFDIIGEVTLGSLKEITQVGKRANFKI